jgi:uncharacterized protein
MLGGVELVPDLSGGIYVPDYDTLIIADLHLEQGTSLARRGIHVPPFDTAVTLAQLESVVTAADPKRLIFLGDSFHDGEGEMRLDEEHVKTLRRLTGTYETIWICGNHDPEPPQDVGGVGAEFLMLGPLTLRHEPTLPSPSSWSGEVARGNKGPPPPFGHLPQQAGGRAKNNALPQLVGGAVRRTEGEFEISGHLHPGCGINQRGRRIYGKCFVSDATRLIMPAFGAYTGGLAVTSRAFDGLFDESQASALMIGRAALHRFPYSRVRGQG